MAFFIEHIFGLGGRRVALMGATNGDLEDLTLAVDGREQRPLLLHRQMREVDGADSADFLAVFDQGGGPPRGEGVVAASGSRVVIPLDETSHRAALNRFAETARVRDLLFVLNLLADSLEAKAEEVFADAAARRSDELANFDSRDAPTLTPGAARVLGLALALPEFDANAPCLSSTETSHPICMIYSNGDDDALRTAARELARVGDTARLICLAREPSGQADALRDELNALGVEATVVRSAGKFFGALSDGAPQALALCGAPSDFLQAIDAKVALEFDKHRKESKLSDHMLVFVFDQIPAVRPEEHAAGDFGTTGTLDAALAAQFRKSPLPFVIAAPAAVLASLAGLAECSDLQTELRVLALRELALGKARIARVGAEEWFEDAPRAQSTESGLAAIAFDARVALAVAEAQAQ